MARELGVKSSAIVKRCQDEGLDVRNHMSEISAGLADQIREWFSEGQSLRPAVASEKLSSEFETILADPAGQGVVIVGPPGRGRSELLRKILQEARDYHSVSVEHVVVESVILKPGQNVSGMLITLSGNLSRGHPIRDVQEYLTLLRNWTRQSPNKERFVIGVDVETSLPIESANVWSQIIPDLPERVKMVFTQAPDDVLAGMSLPNMVVMRARQVPLPDYSTPHGGEHASLSVSEASAKSQPILGETVSVGPFTVNWRELIRRFDWQRLQRHAKAIAVIVTCIVAGAVLSYRWWTPLLRYAPGGNAPSTSIKAETGAQSSPGIITTGPNSPVTVNYGRSNGPRVSSSADNILCSLKDICQDIDSRPLLQRQETAKHYQGARVKREPLNLLEIIEEDQVFLLLMIFPGDPYAPFSGGWGISCRVARDAYPELVGAKRGLLLHVSGVIQEATGNSVMLANANIELE